MGIFRDALMETILGPLISRVAFNGTGDPGAFQTPVPAVCVHGNRDFHFHRLDMGTPK